MPRHRPDLQGSAREMAELNAEFWRICTVGMLVECAYLLFALMRGRELKYHLRKILTQEEVRPHARAGVEMVVIEAAKTTGDGSPSCEGGS